MTTIKVVNIKCGGCEKGIISALEKEGLKNVQVDVSGQEVSFEGDRDRAAKKLTQMGYPEAGSPAAKSLLKKAKSFVSCAIGKTK
ncbi:heavy metal transporter [Candidatus Falkowbacteria bacterium CG11_big_fil_rev_8_21_14_0_20_39_10]|uniref:Heavy metal transporter n=1 Tax=Candidatus Falkowbacteria bacterium CG11_big_fil_rev_8_21_14_0_20_39_10 TaxID=1974570 RepID=A0A2M6K8N1_9BACT|nr:MAG: heavy metal transporter [Candidatus Falkowbacteria bacterium CG11_big_fil_rev_8_21_14_0_20_39_10]